MIDDRAKEDLRLRLLAWFDRAARDLPWRRTRDPYAIWLSEVMLQQTRVETVIPYYGRFLARFPSVAELADAPIDDVLGEWAGLGYYRRARSFHAAAREVVDRHEGRVPRSSAELLSLPGIGRYTAGAIASIAFDLPEPLVDGNVQRVLSRVLGLEPGTSEAALYDAARALVPDRRAGAFNQAMMELGATVCSPEAPRCEVCPLAGSCVAQSTARTGELGRAPPRRKPRAVKLLSALVKKADRILLGKRPLGGLFGGLWEPPMLEGSRRSTSALFREAGIVIGERVATLKHVLTHRVLEVDVRSGTVSAELGDLPGYEALALVDSRKLGAVSALAKKIVALASLSLAFAHASPAHAEEDVHDPVPAQSELLNLDPIEKAPPLPAGGGPYVRMVGTASMGKGLRFSNPYRLESQLGETASSVSLTAAFFDASFAFTFGDPDGLQHGGAAHLGTSVEGVTQPYASLSYLLAYRAGEPFLVHGRVGPALLLAPDLNVGGEVAGGFSYFFTAGLGLTSELTFDLFYGAATLDSQFSAIPVLSLALGVVVDYEVLP